MRHISPSHAAAILTEMRDNQNLATASLQARAVWLNLVLAMLAKPHTAYGLRDDPERLAELAVGPISDVHAAVVMLLQCGALTQDIFGNGYLHAPVLRRLGLT